MYIDTKRKTKDILGYLFNRMGNLVIKEAENITSQSLLARFAHLFLVKKSGGKSFMVRENRKLGTNKANWS